MYTFVVLIVVSTYTAHLAAALSREKGHTTIAQFFADGGIACTSADAAAQRAFLESNTAAFPPSQIKYVSSFEGQREMLADGKCDAIFDMDVVVEHATGAHCTASGTPMYDAQLDRVFNMGLGIGIGPNQPAGVARTLSAIVACLKAGRFLYNLHQRHVVGSGCSGTLVGEYEEGEGALQVEHFLGLFVGLFGLSLILMATARDLKWVEEGKKRASAIIFPEDLRGKAGTPSND